MIFNPKGFRALEVSISKKKNKTKHFCQSVSFMKKMFLNEKKNTFLTVQLCVPHVLSKLICDSLEYHYISGITLTLFKQCPDLKICINIQTGKKSLLWKPFHFCKPETFGAETR